MPRVRRAGAAHPLRENETNYCARCQTGGRLLADRAMSRLLKEDWPRSIDDVE
jgi:formamidopyrimidine-DNA glycosylase